ncbi:MAG: hypothetical protein K0B85_08645 [Coriobacteriia bacterium]|nr:hypothetical protein [Coriobacteriia bacterium]
MTPPRGNRRALLITASVAAVVLLAVLAVDTTYGMSDGACTACHDLHAAGLDSGAHQSVPCLSCHLDHGVWSAPAFKAGQWTGMYPSHFLGWEPGPVKPVSRSSCESCHEPVFGAMVESRGLRIDHTACAAAPVECGACHGGVAHGEQVRWVREPVMEECVTCHESTGAPRECDDCHDGRLEAERLTQGPWRVTHGPEWQATHAMGDYDTCLVCHDSSYCGKCHGVAVPHPAAFGSAHGRWALDEEAACETCHATSSFCDACHGIPMPHPSGYLRVHSADASSDDDPRCVSCHERDSCIRCHVRHIHPGGAELAPGTEVGAP